MERRSNPCVAWLIGDPVSHSLSPLLHNAAFKKVGLPHVYVPLRLPHRLLRPFFGLAPHARTLGMNVTVPHKEAVLRFIDHLSPEAKVCGAVNCIRVRGRRLEGFNTDGSGFLAAIKKEFGFDARGKRVVILGAGGAAKGVAHALAPCGLRSIIILNRTVSRARSLAVNVRTVTRKTIVESAALDRTSMEHAAEGADLIVQTTSVGLDGRSAIRFPFQDSPRQARVADIVYRPLETPFLKAAKKAGRRTLGGWAMFLYQAAESFQIWTGQPAPIPLMRRLLLSSLRPD
ncbi:MAG: shikimate dehydrogenase [Nitrospirae bacterium]|nr:shikimate dehydrogenase [Nitrospirota bacterium]